MAQEIRTRKLKDLSKLSEHIKRLPKVSRSAQVFCGECQKGKQVRAAHKKVNVVTTTRPLELLHMDLVGPTQNMSVGGKMYFMVIVDDYTRYTWVGFLREKSDAYHQFKIIAKRIMIEKQTPINRIRSDHGGEFENHRFQKYCEKHGIHHEFSAPKTLQQNGVAERKNRVV